MQKMGASGFVSAGGTTTHRPEYWESQGGTLRLRGAPVLYHVAILYPDRADLADALQRFSRRY